MGSVSYPSEPVLKEGETTHSLISSCPKLAVFHNLDIMEIVLDALLSGYKPSPAERQYLLYAALATKMFFNPAMNILWRYLGSLIPVLRLIPTFELLGNERDGIYTTTLPISEEGLVKLDQYCWRVRRLHLTDNGARYLPIAGHIYFALQELRPFRLFPSLKKLTVDDLEKFLKDDMYGLRLIPSSTLSMAKFSGMSPGSNVHVATFLNQLLKLDVLLLAELHLEGRVLAETLSVLEQFNILVTLNLDLDLYKTTFTAQSLIIAVSQIANLTRLALSLKNSKDDWPHSWNHVANNLPQCFPTLERLETLEMCADIQRMCIFMAAGVNLMPCLIKLTLTFILPDVENLESFAALERHLTEAITHAPLIMHCQLRGYARTNGGFPWKVIEHVQNWQTLKNLQIDFPKIIIDEEQSKTPMLFTEELECLEKLFLRAGQFRLGRKGVNLTLLNLQRIAHMCPNLLEVAIYVPVGLFVESDAVWQGMGQRVKESRNCATAVPQHGLRKLILLPPQDELELNYRPSMQNGVLFPELEQVDFKQVEWIVGEDWCNSVAAIIRLFNRGNLS